MKSLFEKYRTLSVFTISSYVLHFVSLGTGIIVFRWLEPCHMGIWQSLILIDTYSTFLRMGVVNGMNREMPLSLGQGNREQAVRYAETALAYCLSTIAVITISFSVAFFFFTIDSGWLMPLAAVFVIVILNQYQTYLLGTFRAREDFDKLAVNQFINAGLRLVTLVLVITYGFAGYAVREVLCLSALVLFTYMRRPLRVRPRFHRQSLSVLIRTGFPSFIGSYVMGIANTLPRVYILNHSTVEALGLYSPVMALFGAIGVFPDSVAQYFYPKMTLELGKTNDPRVLWSKVRKMHIALLPIGVFMVAAGWYAIPAIIPTVFPQYAASQEVMQIGLFLSMFLSFRFGFMGLVVLQARRYMVVFAGMFLLFQYVFPIVFGSIYPPLRAAVMGHCTSAALMVVVSLITNYLATHPLPKHP